MKKFNYISIFICISFIAMLVITGLTSAAEMTSPEGQKEEYKQKTKGKLSGFERDIKEIEAKSKETGARAKADIRKGIQELKEKHKVAKSEMKKLDSAGKETWKNVKKDLDKAMDELEKTFNKVRAYFKSE
jgi:uncharacterized protein YpuA (DUF1002 family)